MNFEPVLKRIGPMGGYQLFVLLVACYCNCTLLLNVGFMVFAGVSYPADCNLTTSEDSCRSHPEYYHSAVIEFNLTHGEARQIPAHINSLTMMGFLIGGLLAGHFSDVHGRKPVWFAGTVAMGLSGAATALSPNWVVFAMFRFTTGLFAANYIICATVMLNEMTSKTYRLLMIQIFLLWELGFVPFSALAYWTRNWRFTTMLGNAYLVPGMFCFWWIYESPRWLMAHDSSAAAHNTLKRAVDNIASRNGVKESDRLLIASSVDDALEKKQQDEQNQTEKPTVGWRYLVERPELLRNLVTLMFCMFTTFGLLYAWLFGAGRLVGNRFLNPALFGLLKVVPITLVVVADRYLKPGRRFLLAFGLSGASVWMLVGAFAKANQHHWLANWSAIIGSCWLNPALLTCYLFPAEIFPTAVRSRAGGLVSTASRVGAILAPQLVNLQYQFDSVSLPGYVAATFAALAAVIGYCMLPETRGKPLPEIQRQITKNSHSEDKQKDDNQQQLMEHRLCSGLVLSFVDE